MSREREDQANEGRPDGGGDRMSVPQPRISPIDRMQVRLQVVAPEVGLITARGYLNREGGQAIADAAMHLRAQGCTKILIDLAGARLFNHLGISSLRNIAEAPDADTELLAVCGLSPTLSRVFQLSDLGLLARVFESPEAARAELAGPDLPSQDEEGVCGNGSA